MYIAFVHHVILPAADWSAHGRIWDVPARDIAVQLITHIVMR